ncbi:hypothetical protein GC174_10445 [bacterium]|nr:hypothetical protein [bacterium]
MTFSMRASRTNIVLSLSCCLMVSAAAPSTLAAPAAKKKAPAKAAAKSAKKPVSGANDHIKLLDDGTRDMIKESFSQAEAKFKKALAQAEAAKNTNHQLESLVWLSASLEKQSRLDEALALRQKALELAKKTFGADSSEYALQLAGMSSFYTKKGNNAQAWNYIEQANATLGKAGGSAKHPITGAYCAIATARIQNLEGSKGLADQSYKKSLDLLQAAMKENAPLVILISKEYLPVLEAIEKTDEAKSLKDKISLAEAAGTTGSANTAADTAPKIQTKLSGKEFAKIVGEAKQNMIDKDFDSALAKWQKALAMAEKEGSQKKLAYVYFKMGDTYSLKDEKEKREALYKKSALLREKMKETETLGMARVLTRLANYEITNKNTDEAKRLLTKALEIETKQKASDGMIENTLRSLASACMMGKDFGKGEEVCRKLIVLAEKDTSPVAETKKAMSTSMLAGLMMQSGRTQEGLSMMQSMNGKLTPESTKAYSNAVAAQFAAVENEVDASEEKSMGIAG